MKFLLRFGFILVLIGIVGFFTIADDFRHTGELLGVGLVLLLGLGMLILFFIKKRFHAS